MRHSPGISVCRTCSSVFVPAPGKIEGQFPAPSVASRAKCREKQERLALVRAQRFVNAVAEQQSVIEDRDLRFPGTRHYTVDVDAGRHSSRARSHSRRCFSVFGVRRGVSIGGSSPKLMFIGAKCFCGVETYRHKAPMAVSAGMIIADRRREDAEPH